MQTWTVVRFLHIIGVAFFVGGQLLLAVAVTPVLRGAGQDVEMRRIARRFGIASVVALALVIASGAAMASHYDMWGRSLLQLKLLLLVLVGVLTGLHIVAPKGRGIAYAIVACSVLIVWFGVKLTWG